MSKIPLEAQLIIGKNILGAIYVIIGVHVAVIINTYTYLLQKLIPRVLTIPQATNLFSYLIKRHRAADVGQV